MSLRIHNPVGNLNQAGRNIGRQATTSQLVESLARLGYMVRGLVYMVIGILALQVALGVGGALTDPQGAIVRLGSTPVGDVVLLVVLIGLIGYALWDVIQGLFDPFHKGSDLKGIAERVGKLVSAVFYGILALTTYGLITPGTAAAGGSQTTQQATASILSYSWGPAAIAIAGVIIILAGLLQFGQGLSREFDRQFQPYALNSTERLWINRLGRFGTAARGVVFVLVGLFLFLAGYQHNPSQAQGISGALAALLHQPYGPWLLGIVALGLIAFGIYSALSGYWLRLRR